MSPTSKSRKKKRGRQGPGYEWVDPEPEAVRQPPAWFAGSTRAVLSGADELVSAAGPRELEQATCELLGEQLHRVVHEGQSGLWFDWWFEELATAAAARVRDADDLGGEWRLLHGMAAIGPPALRSFARHQVNSLGKLVRRRPAFRCQPRWLGLTHLVKATGEVWRMDNAYGTRIGVLAGLSYPHGADPSVFLLDIDACEFTTLANAGAYDDLERAAAAWRALVGDTAGRAEPVEVRSGEQLSCLAYCDLGEDLIGDETRNRLDNWFRANRCVHDLAHALRKSPRLWSPPVSLYDLDIEPMTREFRGWYADRHGTEPDQDAVDGLAEEWLEGVLPETRYSISPHRVRSRRSLIDDGWLPDDPATVAVRPLLAEWARWLGERSGLPPELVDRAAAEAAVVRNEEPALSDVHGKNGSVLG